MKVFSLVDSNFLLELKILGLHNLCHEVEVKVNHEENIKKGLAFEAEK